MLITLAIYCIQLSVPSAADVEKVVNSRLTDTAFGPGHIKNVEARHRLISEDGSTAFVFDGKVHRVPLMRSGGPSGGEDIFFYSQGGDPASLTTSQAAHSREKRGELLSRTANLRLLFAPNDSDCLVAAPLSDGSVRLAAIRFAERGDNPNCDRSAPAGATALSAVQANGSIDWYVAAKSAIIRTGGENQLVTTVTVPKGFIPEAYDPEARIALTGVDAGELRILWGSTGRVVSVVLPPGSYAWTSRGEVFYTLGYAVFKLSENDHWERFCNQKLLATSALGKYWVVQDSSGSVWRVTF